VCDIVVKKFTFAISSPDEFFVTFVMGMGRDAKNSETVAAFCYCV